MPWPKIEGLTSKQKLFVEAYAISLNATQAAIDAGYPAASAKVTGSRNLHVPAIRAALADVIDKRNALIKPKIPHRKLKDLDTSKIAIDTAWIMEELKVLYETAKSSGDIQLALNAIEKIGKHTDVQAWLEKTDITTNGQPVNIPPMPQQIAIMINSNLEKSY